MYKGPILEDGRHIRFSLFEYGFRSENGHIWKSNSKCPNAGGHGTIAYSVLVTKTKIIGDLVLKQIQCTSYSVLTDNVILLCEAAYSVQRTVY